MEIDSQRTEKNNIADPGRAINIINEHEIVTGPIMRNYLWILYLILLIMPQAVTMAQDDSDNRTTKQLWLDFNPSYKVSERVGLYGKIGARTTFPNNWSRYLITPSVKYDWPRMILKDLKYREELHAGIGFYYTDNKYSVDRLEIRPFQGYSLSAPNRKRIVIKHFVMLEERFEMETNDWVNTFGLRLRYRASVTLRFQGDIWQYGKGFYIPVSGEFFWNLKGTKQFNDKVRLVGGIGRDFTTHWKMAFLFGYHYTRHSVDEKFGTNDIMFRFRVYYKIN